ncbi:MAG: hypothetical protein IKX51_03445, partial [Bacteroidales bacterium]|nr:hypothetical protein [Bacteroidales bacterium]
MKKIFRLLGVALVATAMVFAGCTKSDEEEEEGVQLPKKVVLLEEFTGNQCGNGPDGHKRANEVKAAF